MPTLQKPAMNKKSSPSEPWVSWRLHLPALLTLICCSLQAAGIESNLKKSFAVKPGGQLVVDVDSGSIEISTGESKEVAVEVKRKITGADNARAQEIFAAHEVTFDQDGGRVEVHAKLKKDANAKLTVKSGGGDLRLGQLDADTSASTASGSITIEAAKAKLTAKTQGGDLRLGQLEGETLADTASGSVSVKSAKAKLTVKSGG